MGNGLANIIAALIVATAIFLNGAGVGGGSASKTDAGAMSEEDFARLYARAVGDIRNDIVVNCGCCGDAKPEGRRRASDGSF